MTMSRACTTLMIITAVTLSGCMPEAVRQIEANKSDYMQSHFAVTDVPQQVAATLGAADSSPMGFHQMKLTLSLTVSRTSDNQINHFVNTTTYTAAGGPYVQILDVLNNNGVPFQEDYSLTYRGLLYLRTQQVQLNALNSNQIFATHSLEPVTAWPASGPGSGDIHFRFEEGLSQQIMNFQSGALNCEFGSVFPAAELNPALLGNAQKLHCEALNTNGVVTTRSEEAWLMRYGIVFTDRMVSSSWQRSWKILRVQMQ
ncbi:MAG TPA: hypothetical protein VIC29_10250 [Steroidobacteraceae bacterium]|jgi:hypothetical protein